MSKEKRFDPQYAINSTFVMMIGITAYPPKALPPLSDAFTKLAYGGIATLSVGVAAAGLYGIVDAIKGKESKDEPKL